MNEVVVGVVVIWANINRIGQSILGRVIMVAASIQILNLLWQVLPSCFPALNPTKYANLPSTVLQPNSSTPSAGSSASNYPLLSTPASTQLR